MDSVESALESLARCVICHAFGALGGGAKVSTFFVTLDLFISAAIRDTIAIKVCFKSPP